MSQSVSFILPVRDLEYGLRPRAQMLLEVLQELTEEFDLLIVDYGSRDETREVALDLVREYPQVDFLDRGGSGDLFSAVEAGIYRTRGEIIFIHDATEPLGATALHSLWNLRDDDDLVMAQSRCTTELKHAFSNLPAGRSAPKMARSSIQMIRRCAMRQLPQRRAEPPVTVDRVTRTDLADEPAEAVRLPKLLTRLKRLTSY